MNGRDYIVNRQPDELRYCLEGDVLLVMFKNANYPICGFVEFRGINERDETMIFRRLSDPKHYQTETRLNHILLWGRKEKEDESVDR